MKITSIVSGLAVTALLGSSVAIAGIGDKTPRVMSPTKVTTFSTTRGQCTKTGDKIIKIHKVVKEVNTSFTPDVGVKHPKDSDKGTCTVTTTFKSI